MLNSRSLIPIANNPYDLKILAPVDFLIGRNLTSITKEDTTITQMNRLFHGNSCKK